MEEAIKAYEKITVSPEFRELERLRFYARHNEASALHHAEKIGEKRGEKIGEKRGKKQILDMLKSGKSPEEIIREMANEE